MGTDGLLLGIAALPVVLVAWGVALAMLVGAVLLINWILEKPKVKKNAR